MHATRSILGLPAVLALASCWGTGGRVVSTAPLLPNGAISLPPAPDPTPTPPAEPLSSPVVMLSNPTTQVFTSFSSGDPLQVRYDKISSTYEVSIANGAWQALNDDPKREPGVFLIGSGGFPKDGVSPNWLATLVSHDSGVPAYRYQYSSLATWYENTTSRYGAVVFGSATPDGAVPVTGTAYYEGMISGEASVPVEGWGHYDHAPLGGTIAMQADFRSDVLHGEIRPQVSCDCDLLDISPVTFDAKLASARGSFTGVFSTDAPGPNSFAGSFAGPAAEEAIGTWTIPFFFNAQSETATGVWVAKKN